jgi:hypothetical protein
MPRQKKTTKESPQTTDDNRKEELAVPVNDFPFGALATPETEAAANEEEIPLPNPVDRPSTRPHVRSWTRDLVLGYQVLSDERLKVLVLKFDEKPAEEILDLVKSKGLKYRELLDHGRAWVIKNDWEGRTLMEQIDQELYAMRTGEARPQQGIE